MPAFTSISGQKRATEIRFAASLYPKAPSHLRHVDQDPRCGGLPRVPITHDASPSENQAIGG